MATAGTDDPIVKQPAIISDNESAKSAIVFGPVLARTIPRTLVGFGVVAARACVGAVKKVPRTKVGGGVTRMTG